MHKVDTQRWRTMLAPQAQECPVSACHAQAIGAYYCGVKPLSRLMRAQTRV